MQVWSPGPKRKGRGTVFFLFFLFSFLVAWGFVPSTPNVIPNDNRTYMDGVVLTQTLRETRIWELHV